MPTFTLPKTLEMSAFPPPITTSSSDTSDIPPRESWSESSSLYTSTNPSRNSLSTDGEEMPQDNLAALFVNDALLSGRRSSTVDSPVHALSKANCTPLTMPKNFAQVLPGVYRAHFPTPDNFTFLRMLGIKTILTLVPEEYPDTHKEFMAQFGIRHFQIGIDPNKDPAITIDPRSMEAALGVIASKGTGGLLVHCNKGKHRTGCVVACLRKIMGWDMARVLAEYRHHAGHKARALDERYIESFDPTPFQNMMGRENRLPSSRMLHGVPEPFIESPAAKSPIPSARLRG